MGNSKLLLTICSLVSLLIIEKQIIAKQVPNTQENKQINKTRKTRLNSNKLIVAKPAYTKVHPKPANNKSHHKKQVSQELISQKLGTNKFGINKFVPSLLVSQQFTIKIEPKWDDLDKNNKLSQFDDKWILAADITIKKTSPNYVALNELNLCWHGKSGKKINQLIASLYEKNSDKNFMPIEQYLICDSIWKKSEQKLILKFKEPKMLFAVNKFSLVLTVPKELINTLKSGHFTLDTECLPIEYQEYAAINNLCLYLCEK